MQGPGYGAGAQIPAEIAACSSFFHSLSARTHLFFLTKVLPCGSGAAWPFSLATDRRGACLVLLTAAQELESLLRDDECSESTCAQNALQLHGLARSNDSAVPQGPAVGHWSEAKPLAHQARGPARIA